MIKKHFFIYNAEINDIDVYNDDNNINQYRKKVNKTMKHTYFDYQDLIFLQFFELHNQWLTFFSFHQIGIFSDLEVQEHHTKNKVKIVERWEKYSGERKRHGAAYHGFDRFCIFKHRENGQSIFEKETANNKTYFTNNQDIIELALNVFIFPFIKDAIKGKKDVD